MITHIVLFKVPEASDADEVVARLRSMRGEIPSLLSVTAGRDVTVGETSWDVGLVTTHTDTEGLKAYQDHPFHLEVSGYIKSVISARAVVDMET